MGHEDAFTAVHRSAWDSPRFTDELWREMAAGLPFADARCLLARDPRGAAVAGVTVWSAGPGKPGLLEPMGVHADHRGRGYGRLICVAAAAELRQMGSSSALVCTQTARDGRRRHLSVRGVPRFSRSGWTAPARPDPGDVDHP